MTETENEVELETTQLAFPVYSNNKRTGHCVLALRVQILDEEDSASVIARSSLNKALYDRAATRFTEIEDARTACDEFKKSIMRDFEVLSASFMKE